MFLFYGISLKFLSTNSTFPHFGGWKISGIRPLIFQLAWLGFSNQKACLARPCQLGFDTPSNADKIQIQGTRIRWSFRKDAPLLRITIYINKHHQQEKGTKTDTLTMRSMHVHTHWITIHAATILLNRASRIGFLLRNWVSSSGCWEKSILMVFFTVFSLKIFQPL